MDLSTVTYGKNVLEDVSFSSVTAFDITLADVKSWAKVSTSDDDDLITDLIDETFDQIEEMINTSLSTRTVTATYSEYGREVNLPYGPVNSLTTVKEIDKGTKETIDSDNYYIIKDRLVFNDLETSQDPYYKKGLEVVYSAGYSATPTGLQNAIKQAILTNYVDREDNVLGGVVRIPSNSRRKALKWKRY